MKIDKTIYVPVSEREATAEIFRCFGWERAGAEKPDTNASGDSVKLTFQRNTDIPNYAEIVRLEARYRAAEAEIRRIEECAAARASDPVLTALLFALFVVPGIVYVLARRNKAGGKSASLRVEALKRKKEALKKEAARLSAR